MTTILAIVASGGDYRCAVLSARGILTLAPRVGRELPRRDLAPTVAELFLAANLTPELLTEIRLDVGPGSYTGLRVAVTFAKTLASFTPCIVRTTSSLSLMAVAALRCGLVTGNGAIACVLDARRERFHLARFAPGERIATLAAPRALSLPEIVSRLQEGDRVLADASALQALRALALPAQVAVLPAPEVTAEDLFDSRLELVTQAAHELEPLYLMGTYAEDSLP